MGNNESIENYLKYLMEHLISLYYVSSNSTTNRMENILNLVERAHFFKGGNDDLNILSDDINVEVKFLKEFDASLHRKYLNSFRESELVTSKLEIERILIRSSKINKIFGNG